MNKGGIQFRYGICLNQNCSKGKTKEVQKVDALHEFICEECKKKLSDCPPPKSFMQKHGTKIYAGVGALLVAGAVAGFVLGGGDSEVKPPVQEPETVIKDNLDKDTVKPQDKDTVALKPVDNGKGLSKEDDKENPKDGVGTNGGNGQTKQPKTPGVQNGYGTVNLGYGKYTGDLKNGKPHGHGTITYTKSHRIVASKDFVASPGDKFEGDFRDGRVSGGMGYWYHDGDVTGVKP